jgi:hypothetical protein
MRLRVVALAALVLIQQAPASACYCDDDYYGYGGYSKPAPRREAAPVYRPAVYSDSLRDDGRDADQDGGGLMVTPEFLLAVIAVLLLVWLAAVAIESSWMRYWKWRAEERERQKISRGAASPKDFHFENMIR